SAGQTFQAFLSLMGQGGDGGGFAPGGAYGNAGAPHRAQLGAGQMRVWGSAYGGHIGLSADPVSGAASLSASNVGMVGGVDMRLRDGLLLGATLGWGGQHFRSDNGTGTSDDVAIGIYGRHEDGALYVSAALGYGWHHIKTLRTLTVSGTDVLQGVQDATDFGGRLETGWHFALDEISAITPYAAFVGDSVESPHYAETAVSGASTFALSVAPHTDALGRMEAGARLSRDYTLEDGTLTGGLQAAWAHQINDVPLTQASFLGLSGANFLVTGVRPARDAALLGAALEMRQRSGFFFGVRGESLLGSGTTTVEGMGELGWHW
ncbi:MAG TPA: autotransporter outer membrane beta-barrel domain-containing protein, partial [Rhizomicrobium sp.]|nr:autotransporter outer membrane beta-barrel domain-containing protein [Rhizomicrobium sp.]